MVSKLKQRRLRRLKADIAWWRAEAEDWKQVAMEHAATIDMQRSQVIRVPMPVIVPAEALNAIGVHGALAIGLDRYGDAMLKLAKKENGDV
jgi:hypothetical protein|nr:MAG TPA: hypothetical protein [Caudoviricetes sp.]